MFSPAEHAFDWSTSGWFNIAPAEHALNWARPCCRFDVLAAMLRHFGGLHDQATDASNWETVAKLDLNDSPWTQYGRLKPFIQVEDPYIWQDPNGNWHLLCHRYDCERCVLVLKGSPDGRPCPWLVHGSPQSHSPVFLLVGIFVGGGSCQCPFSTSLWAALDTVILIHTESGARLCFTRATLYMPADRDGWPVNPNQTEPVLVSGHAFSVDGVHWNYSSGPQPFDPWVVFEDGSRQNFSTLERPHLVFDETGVPTHTVHGASPVWDQYVPRLAMLCLEAGNLRGGRFCPGLPLSLPSCRDASGR